MIGTLIQKNGVILLKSFRWLNETKILKGTNGCQKVGRCLTDIPRYRETIYRMGSVRSVNEHRRTGEDGADIDLRFYEDYETYEYMIVGT